MNEVKLNKVILGNKVQIKSVDDHRTYLVGLWGEVTQLPTEEKVSYENDQDSPNYILANEINSVLLLERLEQDVGSRKRQDYFYQAYGSDQLDLGFDTYAIDVIDEEGDVLDTLLLKRDQFTASTVIGVTFD